MNIAERHQFILNKIQQEGHINVIDLCQELDVSSVTIRKDLKLLEQRGLLYRTHGGAYLHNPYVTDRPVTEKARLHADEKEHVAQAAATLVAPRDTVILASGTTVHAVARHLAARRGPEGVRQLTVVTSSLVAAQELSRHPEVEVLQLGGLVRPSSASVVGPYAVSLLAEHACDKLFLGVDGFDLAFGLTTTSLLEAELNQAMIRAAQRTIVVLDSTKFGQRGFRRICGIEDVDIVVTDEAVDPDVVAELEALGVEVEVARSSARRSPAA